MMKTNDQNNIQADGSANGTPTNGVIIVQQQPANDQQQHFVLSAVNNSAPMVLTTPLGNISQSIFSFVLLIFQLSCSFRHHSTITRHNNKCSTAHGSKFE
jgi:hypothetical protein